MKQFLLVCLFIIPIYTYAATDPKLDAACDDARDAMLAPERDSLIKQCVADGKSKSHCNNFYKTYGDASGNARTGNYQKRQYDHLPECVAAQEARSQHRQGSDPSSKNRDSGRTSNLKDSDPKRTNYREGSDRNSSRSKDSDPKRTNYR